VFGFGGELVCAAFQQGWRLMIANKADALAEIVRLQDSYERLRASHDRQMEVILAASNRYFEYVKWLEREIKLATSVSKVTCFQVALNKFQEK
jgi:hypothetical protein